jgi:hypothetical protein
VKEVNANQKGPYILNSEEAKTIKKLGIKKSTGDYDVPGDIIKLL